MLRDHLAPTAQPDTAVVVLTCGDPSCRYAFEPDRHALATGSLACPHCEGWTFQAGMVEPRPAGGERA